MKIINLQKNGLLKLKTASANIWNNLLLKRGLSGLFSLLK